MRMIRKQLYIGPEHQEKLRRIAARWGCTEAEVVRVALERLPDLESAVDARLVEAGLLAPRPSDPDLAEGAELDALETEVEAWLAGLPAPLDLTQVVLEDRR